MLDKTTYKTPDLPKREDKEVERNVKPAPKKKPPRDDRRRRHLREEDQDLDAKDPDLSLNYKDVGGARQARPWKIEPPTDTRDTFLVHDGDLKPHYFDDQDEAEIWLEDEREKFEEAGDKRRQQQKDKKTEKDEKAKTPFRVLPPTSKRKDYLVFDKEGKEHLFPNEIAAEDYAEAELEKEQGTKRKKDVKVNRKKVEEDIPPYEMDEKTLENIRYLQSKSSALPKGLTEWLGDPTGAPPLDKLREHYGSMDNLQLSQARASLSKLHAYLTYFPDLEDPEDSRYGAGLSTTDADKILRAMDMEISRSESQIKNAPSLKTPKDIEQVLEKSNVDQVVHALKKIDPDELSEVLKTFRTISLDDSHPLREKAIGARDAAEQIIFNQSFESQLSIDGALKSLNRESLMDPSSYDFSDEGDRAEFLAGMDSLSDSDLISAFKEIPIYGLLLGIDGDTDPNTQPLSKDHRDRLKTYIEQDLRMRAFFNDFGIKSVTSNKLKATSRRIEDNKITKKQEGLIRRFGSSGQSLLDIFFSILRRPSMRRKTSSRRVVAQYLGLPGPVDSPLSHMPPRAPWRVKNTFELDMDDALGILQLALSWHDRDQMERQEESHRRRMALDYAIYTYQSGALQVAVDAPTYRMLERCFETYLDEN